MVHEIVAKWWPDLDHVARPPHSAPSLHIRRPPSPFCCATCVSFHPRSLFVGSFVVFFMWTSP
uniref:Uncharacterized protein n=1 Tax=Fagus sylvatica TaxID=28930 RepID=A0A2N9G1Q0_FAGSY